jgi:putative ATP-binding cassette transporter
MSAAHSFRSADDNVIVDPATSKIAENIRRVALLTLFCASAKGFWGKDGDRLAWILSIGLLIITLLNIGIMYEINLWNRDIFDALEQRNSAGVFSLSLIFVPLALGGVALAASAVFIRMTTQRRWRGWLNDLVVGRWLAKGRYYQLNLIAGEHQNPEFRIAEDLRNATDAPVDFSVGILSAALSAVTFIAVLWNIGGDLNLSMFGNAVAIPGFLVIAAFLYAVIASGSMAYIGGSFIQVSENKNQAEAEYRFTLTRVRENGESIAFLGGEAEERAGIDRNLAMVLFRWRQLCGQYVRTTVVSQASSLVAPVIAIILTAPKFLDGSMSLGQLMQAASAFTIVQGSFGWLVDNYPRVSEWSASARRVASLMLSLDALELAEQGGESVTRIEHGVIDDDALRLSNLNITLDDGTAVMGETEVRIMSGERVLIVGDSGTGKSILVRAIAGLWPWGGGSIEINRSASLFLLPQRPYIPSGTLWRAAVYPSAITGWSESEVARIFKLVGLGHLVDQLTVEGPWDQTLSGGEKQRLAFARLFLHRPDIIVLDEATSALDPKSQDAIMTLLARELKKATVISVGHRPELEAFHSRKIVLERRSGGAQLVSDTILTVWSRQSVFSNLRARLIRLAP